DVALTADACAHRLGDLRHDVLPAVVHDRMYGVEPQTVEVVFLQPVESIVDEEITHRPAVVAIEVDGCSPGGVMPLGKELGRIQTEIVSFRTEMVVDHVQYDGEPPLMGS